MVSDTEYSNEIHSELPESRSPADQAGAVIVLLDVGLSLAFGFVVYFFARQPLIGVVCGLGVFAVLVLIGEPHATKIAEKVSREEAQVTRGDATDSVEAQRDQAGVAVRMSLRKHGETLTACESETSPQGEDPEAWLGSAAALFELRKHDQALQRLDEAIRLNADAPEAWYWKGLCLLELGRRDEAVVAFEKVIALSSNMTESGPLVA